MIRTKLTTAFTAVGLTALALTAIPGVAQASESAPSSPTAIAAGPAGATADGYFYAYENANYGGKYCRWVGNDSDWSSCSPGGNIRNQASALWNNGYAGSYEDVNVYWGLGYTGAWACIANGYAYSNLAGWNFPNNGSGGGETLNDNISSHVWSNSC
ncbi:peptidase inhibitor family I36 protein [Streptomyces hokutonensis]|uniref:peptidase inhibitor family I36 protein n=1 Tax=Streptomyces hokutonensis TaxID=1306990 RepID=UPI0033C2F052